jgi:hypothetical protein
MSFIVAGSNFKDTLMYDCSRGRAPQSIDHFVTDSQEAGEKNAMLLLHIFSPLSRD